jgi:hypothetical protein
MGFVLLKEMKMVMKKVDAKGYDSLITYKRYYAKIAFVTALEGGTPKDPSVIETWLKTKGKSRADLYQETVEAMGAEAVSNGDVEANLMNKGWSGFKSGEDGLYIEARQIKAAFKEAANVNRPALVKHNPALKQAKARLAERVFVWGADRAKPDIVLLGRDEPSGYEERMVHVVTRTGKISAIKRTDYVSDLELGFNIEVLDDRLFTENVLRILLDYMGRNGLGANRSQGAGQFRVLELTEMQEAA